MEHRPTTLYMSDLLGCKIVTTRGKNVGRLVDMCLSIDSHFQVTDLVYSQTSFLYNLRALRSLATKLGMHFEQGTIPWSAVERMEGAKLIVKSY